MTQEAISDLGTGSHNLVGGAHVTDIKQTGWDRGLPRHPGRGRGGRCPPCLSLLGVLPVPLLGTRLQDTRELTSFKTSHSPAPPPVGAPPPPWRSHAPARGLNAPARGLSPPARPPSSPPGRSHGPCLDRGFSAKLSEVCLAVPAACLVLALPAWALLALVNSWLHLQG